MALTVVPGSTIATRRATDPPQKQIREFSVGARGDDVGPKADPQAWVRTMSA
jgi:hypothetical protein